MRVDAGGCWRDGKDPHASAKKQDRTANAMRACVFVAVNSLNAGPHTMAVIGMAAMPTIGARVGKSSDAAQRSSAKYDGRAGVFH